MVSESVRRASDEPAESPLEEEFREFSYIVSHDLAASFRHVSGFLQLLVGDLGDALTDRQRGFADQVEAASGRCGRMLERLLEFSRMQQQELRRERADATLLAQTALMRIGGGEGAEVAIETLGTVDADSALVVTALSRLLDNAMRFHPPGEPARVHVSAIEADGAWVVRVRDHGVGVPPERREQVFRMFQQLAPELHPDGLGVGLTTARRIARRHGGDICFVDADVGACVEMRLPYQQLREL